jgi:hypothetical protein
VSFKWFEASQKAGKLIRDDKEIQNFFIYDKEFETNYQCNLKQIYQKDLSALLSN